MITIPRGGHIFKAIFTGDPTTGKTSIIARYVSSVFQESYLPTVGASISSKDIDFDGHSVKLVIWDIASHKAFRRMRESYYGGASAAFIVYDITRSETFENVKAWFEEFKKFVPAAIQLMVIGNKIDLPRKIDRKDGEQVAKEIGAEFMETSPKTGENIERVFENVIKKLLITVLPSPLKKKGK